MSSKQTNIQTGIMVQPKSKIKFILICCLAKLWKGEKCKCKKIKTIQKYIRKWQENKNKLEPITYRGDKIKINDIIVFTYKNRSKNDSYNKIRENIISCIINNIIPEQYYTLSPRWYNLKTEIILFIKELCKKKGICIDNIECIPKAGRSNHYDFKIIVNKSEEFKIEFKCNASCVNDCPQFNSPMKPSQYLSLNFEEFFYDNYLYKIAINGNLTMPNRDEYLKNIHSNSVSCMKEFKDKYDTDKNFKKFCKKIDKEAIKKFIDMTEINISKLSNYLLDSQKDKHYMCFDGKKFKYDTLDQKLFKITHFVKKTNTTYIYETELGYKLEIRLRFKNGCGLQFPAFQIHRKLPTVKELKKISYDNGITNIPRLKKDILKMLDNKGIIY